MKRNNSHLSNKGVIGAIISAIVASACCIGPLVVLGLGLGGAWVGNLTILEPYRPIFMLITLAFLGYAFYRIYRKPAAEKCEPGSYCSKPNSNKINKISLWTTTILILGLLASPYFIPYIYGKKSNSTTTKGILQNPNRSGLVCEDCAPDKILDAKKHEKVVVLEVPDMHCPACPITVQKSLVQLDGVIKAEADLKSKTARVVFDPIKINVQTLIDATTKVGYTSHVKKTNNGDES